MISREEQASYQYNTLYQLTGVAYEKQPGEFIPEARSDESYQYDGVGNLIKRGQAQRRSRDRHRPHRHTSLLAIPLRQP